jgi:hypothetical protein
MTPQEINNKIVDVIYDSTQIYHVLEPNQDGVRGVPFSQFMIRDTLGTAKSNLSHLDQTKIIEFENNLIQQL